MSLTEEQVAERFTGIGGSDAAAALGLHPFRSSLELFLDKRERHDRPFASAAAHWGNLLEPVLRQEYSNITGRVVRIPDGTVRSVEHPFMLAHVDGVTSDRRLVELKTSRSAEHWGKAGTDEVPHHYLIQVQHYLAVLGYEVADIAVLIGSADFRLYEVPADPETQSLIIAGEADFWRLVENNEAPGPDYDLPGVTDLLRRLYPGTNGVTLQASPSDAEWRRTLEEAREHERNYRGVADGAKAHLLEHMGNAARMIFPDGTQLTRKLVSKKGYTVEPTQFIDARISKVKESTA